MMILIWVYADISNLNKHTMQKKRKTGLIYTSATLLVAIVGFLVSFFNLFDQIKAHLWTEKKYINVGILQTLKYDYYKPYLINKYITPANNRLSQSLPNYEFKLVDVAYTGMFNDLYSESVDIVFSSPYTFIAFKEGKIPLSELKIPPSELKVEAIRGQDSTGNIYYSYVIYNKNSDFEPTDEKLTKNNFEKDSFNIFIGTNWSSTSTRVIPRIYLWEKGIILKSQTNQDETENIVDIMKKARPEDCFIGFLSSADYYSLPDSIKNKLGNFAINIPIPSDPILINKTSFNQKFGKNETIIKNAIISTNRAEKIEDWNNPIFEKYVATGVVYAKNNNNEAEIIFPIGTNDLFNNLVKIKVDTTKISFLRFSTPTQIPNSSYLESKNIGKGKISGKLSPDCFKANCNDKVKIGDHVILEN